jgi:hypothetical protein
VRAGTVELLLLDREHEERARPQIERDRPLALELSVPADRLVAQLVDPPARIAKQEAPVAPGGARAETAPVDDQDALARLCKETRRRAAGDAGSDDDGFGGA